MKESLVRVRRRRISYRFDAVLPRWGWILIKVGGAGEVAGRSGRVWVDEDLCTTLDRLRRRRIFGRFRAFLQGRGWILSSFEGSSEVARRSGRAWVNGDLCANVWT